MTRDSRDYLQDVLTSIDEAAEFTKHMSLEKFLQDRKTSKAVVRCLEELGEAAKQVPEIVRRLAPDVPWKRMAGMRDKLIHQYFGVDLAIVWTVVEEELPPLRPRIQKLLRDLDSQET
ncbi:MAG: DUF86 domain-containing protein [Candidatus Hydrogenedentes bacterium]|nr:DUF86 domain-containing protein [Candidatus Hydrogenedentota bacterium]